MQSCPSKLLGLLVLASVLLPVEAHASSKLLDFDGDGKTDYAVWRPSNGTWWIVLSGTNGQIEAPWGQTGDIPVARDYDGDGKTDYAVFRPSNATWWVVRSSTGASVEQQLGVVSRSFCKTTWVICSQSNLLSSEGRSP